MSDPNDIKVLVKKADGTYVHVSLAELNKKDQSISADPGTDVEVPDVEKTGAKSVVIEDKRTKKIDAAPPQNLPIEDATILKPKSNIKFDLPKLAEPVVKQDDAPKINAENGDFESLLQEKLPVESRVIPLTSAGRDKQIDAVLATLSFKIPAGNTSRLRTVIQLFLKDVRGEDATVEILRRKEIDGGLGLTEEEAAEVIQKSKKTALPVEVTPVPVLKDMRTAVRPLSVQKAEKKDYLKDAKIVGMDLSENKRLESELPSVIAEQKAKPQQSQQSKLEATSTQINTQVPTKPVFSTIQKPQPQGITKKILDEQVTKATLAEAPIEPFRINPEQIKPTMHDVRPNTVSIGPVDEIRGFSLIDFRRLSTDPTEAAKRLKQKFLNLREESIMLYFEGWEAWKNSPLYHEYINSIADSIRQRTPLLKINAADRSKIQMPEIAAIVRMEKQLG